MPNNRRERYSERCIVNEGLDLEIKVKLDGDFFHVPQENNLLLSASTTYLRH